MPTSSTTPNEAVMSLLGRRRRSRAQSEAEPPLADVSDNPEDLSPASRLAQINVTSDSYAKEYRLRLVSRLLMRNIPLDQIASQLNVSLRTVQRDRRELAEMMRQEARKLDTNQIIGDTKAFYEETIGMALRAASVGKAPIPMRMLAIRTAMAGKKEMNNFLLKAGVFEAMPYTAHEEGTVDDMSKVMDAIDAALRGDAAGFLKQQDEMNFNLDNDSLEAYE
jgi:hypothetical protein